MPRFIASTATCAKCGAANRVQLAAGINGVRRPDLRDAVLDGTFQSFSCANCGATMRLPAHLTYLDLSRDQWILVENASRMNDWRTAEDAARATYRLGFGDTASDAAREIGRTLVPRLVFGWTALREKLLAQKHGLHDVTLELLKLSILRNVPKPPFSSASELRLVRGTAMLLELHWLERTTGSVLGSLTVPRALYDDLADRQDGWIPLRAGLETGFYVDMNRLVFA